MIRNGVRARSKVPRQSRTPGERVTLAPDAADSEAPGGGTGIDAVLMGQLTRLISESDLAELEIEKGDLRIRMVRYSPAPAASPQVLSQAPSAPATVAVVAPAQVVTSVPSVSISDADHPGAIKSPMVGTAYRRASPDSKPFVEIGTTVKVGEKVLLVEAMKTFNEIVASKAGTVTAIFVDDGQPVEYGEPLLIIE